MFKSKSPVKPWLLRIWNSLLILFSSVPSKVMCNGISKRHTKQMMHFVTFVSVACAALYFYWSGLFMAQLNIVLHAMRGCFFSLSKSYWFFPSRGAVWRKAEAFYIFCVMMFLQHCATLPKGDCIIFLILR